MSWVALDDKFHSNPKVLSVGNAGAGVYARALAYCGDQLTDGFVPFGWAREVATTPLRKKLEDARLWRTVEGGYQIPDYLDLNPSAEQVKAKRAEVSAARSEAGKRGAAARWDGKRDGKKDGKSMANGWPQAPTPSPSENPRPGGNQDSRSETVLEAQAHALRLFAAIRDEHKDDGTKFVIMSLAYQLPSEAFDDVLVELGKRRRNIRHEGKWVNGALRKRARKLAAVA